MTTWPRWRALGDSSPPFTSRLGSPTHHQAQRSFRKHLTQTQRVQSMNREASTLIIDMALPALGSSLRPVVTYNVELRYGRKAYSVRSPRNLQQRFKDRMSQVSGDALRMPRNMSHLMRETWRH
jgi:hypothetical protein